MSLPPVAELVSADAVAVLPVRLRGKLDAVVEQVRGWHLERDGTVVTVRVDVRTVVTLTTPVTEPGDVLCSCLLAPRCLHRAAVLSAAPVLTEAPVLADGPVPAGVPAPPVARRGPAPIVDAQVDAARELWSAAAALLGTGVPGAGAVARADVLRGVHQARAAGLHGPSAAAVRVVEHLRAARRDDPAFRLAELTDDLRDLLGSCHRVISGDPTAVGVARRDYRPVGDLRLVGLFCEPVRAATRHAGAVTYLADTRSRLWTVTDVTPGEPAAAVSATRASVELGEVRLSHHDLSRAGLVAVNAHASPAGRLSHGRARQAVAAAGAGWSDPPLDALWRVDPVAQVDRWLAAGVMAPHERPATSDLAFLDGVVLGADHRGLLLAVDGHDLVVAVTAPHDDPALPYVGNLRQLAAHAAGHPVRLAARFTGARRVAGLAFAAPWLPVRHSGHVDLGVTALTRADLPGAGPVRGTTGGDPPSAPLHLLRHQLERVVATGRAALLPGVDDDARRLAAAHLGGAAAVLAELGAAGVRRTRDVFGRLDPHDAQVLARAWLTAAVYEWAAARALTRTAWTTAVR